MEVLPQECQQDHRPVGRGSGMVTACVSRRAERYTALSSVSVAEEAELLRPRAALLDDEDDFGDEDEFEDDEDLEEDELDEDELDEDLDDEEFEEDEDFEEDDDFDDDEDDFDDDDDF